MIKVSAFPLSWVAGLPRTPAAKRKDSPFRVSNGIAVVSLFEELRKLDARKIIVSSNQPIRADNKPYAQLSREAKDDPGVAVYGEFQGKPFSFACDTFNDVFANFRALALCLEDYRRAQRYGINQLAGQVYQAFEALPAPGMAISPSWSSVLGVGPGDSLEVAEAAYKILAKTYHPDVNPSPDAEEKFRQINEAIRTRRQMEKQR